MLWPPGLDAPGGFQEEPTKWLLLALKNAAICSPKAVHPCSAALLYSISSWISWEAQWVSAPELFSLFPSCDALPESSIPTTHISHLFQMWLKREEGTGHKYSFPGLLSEPGNTQRSGMASVGLALWDRPVQPLVALSPPQMCLYP